jgi:hypothetical protein
MNGLRAQQACAKDRQRRVLRTRNNDLTSELLPAFNHEFVHACLFLICPSACGRLVVGGCCGAVCGVAILLCKSH